MTRGKNPASAPPKGNQRARRHDPGAPLKTLSPRVSRAVFETLQGRAEKEGIKVTALAARILEEATR